MYALMANTGRPEGAPAPPPVTLPAPLPGAGGKPLAGKRAGVYWKVSGHATAARL